MIPTFEQISQILSKNRNVKVWYDEMIPLFQEYDITTPERIAGFLSQVGHESNDFTILEENLNYSAKGLTRVFGKYFRSRDPNAYARQPEKIANLVYGNRMDNGPESSGDGYRFRGRGAIQLTGKYNYTQFAKEAGFDSAESVIPYLETIKGSVHAALWYWNTRNINRHADRRDVRAMTKAINGGTNGLNDRTDRWNRAMRILGSAPVSVSKSNLVFRVGSTGEMVRRIQGHLGITADGKFGPNTEAALKNWQKRKGLTVDGIAGPNTLSKMGLI